MYGRAGKSALAVLGSNFGSQHIYLASDEVGVLLLMANANGELWMLKWSLKVRMVASESQPSQSTDLIAEVSRTRST